MDSGGPLGRTTFSAAALVVVLIGLPLAVAGISGLAFVEDDAIIMPENNPNAGLVSSPMVMTSTGTYDPSVTDWCNDGYWNGGTKLGTNWLACPYASSAQGGNINGIPAFGMYSCSWFADPVHGNYKCGDTDLQWNIYGFEWAERVQNESLTSFSIEFVSMTSTHVVCSDTQYFDEIYGSYTLEFNAGFSQIVGSGPGYRFNANDTILMSEGDLVVINSIPVGYDSAGNQLCVPYFSMSVQIDPFVAVEIQELAEKTNLSNEWLWITLSLDDLYVPNQNVGYHSWTGTLPWDDVEPYHGVSIRIGTVGAESASTTMQVATWALSLGVAAFALACTPFWNPVSDFLKRGMRA
jgi:hypothetical protein